MKKVRISFILEFIDIPLIFQLEKVYYKALWIN
jgi:hypothetical protein